MRKVEGKMCMLLERMAHHDKTAEEVWSHQRTPTGSHSTKVMANDAFDLPVAQSMDEDDHISDNTCQSELSHVGIAKGRVVPSCGTAIAPLVESNNIIACFGYRQHDFSPGICQLGVAMTKYDQRLVALYCVSGFQDMESESIGGALNIVFCDAWRQRERRQCVL